MSDIFITLLVIVAIACAFLGGLVGAQKNASGTGAILGLVFGPLGVIAAFALDARPKCPNCMTHLNGRAKECPSCRKPLFWTAQQNSWDSDLVASLEPPELPKPRPRPVDLSPPAPARDVASDLAAVGQSSQAAARWVKSGIVGAVTSFDGLLYRMAGSEVNLLYRFFQVLAYWGVVPLLVIVALKLTIWR